MKQIVKVFLDGVPPILAIAAIGCFMAKRGIRDPAAAAVINKVVFLISIPALGFRLISRRRLRNSIGYYWLASICLS